MGEQGKALIHLSENLWPNESLILMTSAPRVYFDFTSLDFPNNLYIHAKDVSEISGEVGMMLFAKTAIVVLGDLADTLGSNTGPLIQQKAEKLLTQTDSVHKEFMPLQEEAELTQEEIMSKWFTEDVFAEAAEEGDFKKD
ncbi:hypothetical protein HKD37_20G057379 [Glycine soja]